MSEFKKLHIVEAVYNAASTDSSGVSNKTKAVHGLGVYIPANAIVTRAWIDVTTTFTTESADGGTIGLYIANAGDLTAAIAVSAAGDVWDAGIHGTLIGTPAVPDAGSSAIVHTASVAATLLKTTALCELKAIVATQALLTGKLRLYVEYLMTEVVV
jgi:hypothetical protein